jgi:hypothetical protein
MNICSRATVRSNQVSAREATVYISAAHHGGLLPGSKMHLNIHDCRLAAQEKGGFNLFRVHRLGSAHLPYLTVVLLAEHEKVYGGGEGGSPA